MKHLLFFIVLFCSPAFAEDLPSLWLEAGKETELPPFKIDVTDWALRFEHRVLASGQVSPATKTGRATNVIIKTPLDPGKTLRTTLYYDGVPLKKVILAASDPFEDRKEWFDKHPIALYDPEKTTAEIFEDNEIPFKRLRSFADIEAVKQGVIIIGEATDFDREKGLAELLRQYSGNGGRVLIVAPKGIFPLFPAPIHIMRWAESPKHLFPDASDRKKGETLALSIVNNQLSLVSGDDTRFSGNKSVDETAIFDIQLKNGGRIVFDREPIFTQWESQVESRWYFKSLIETLSNHKGDQQ